MKKVGILYHPMIEATRVKAKELLESLDSRGVSVWVCSAWEKEEARSKLDGTDLILAIGGDGTILRTAQIVIPTKTPITGVNLGKLGFTTELSGDEAAEKLPSLLAGEGWIDERAMLEAELSSSGKQPLVFHALNDVVVARGAIARVIYIETRVDNQLLATYKADGIILATATGSTGYSLAAGGPILYPQCEDFLLVPIAPHLSPTHAVVLPKSATVKLKITAVHQATLSIDGHTNLPLSSGDSVTVRHSQNTVSFLRIQPKASFYSSLEEKLKGK